MTDTGSLPEEDQPDPAGHHTPFPPGGVAAGNAPGSDPRVPAPDGAAPADGGAAPAAGSVAPGHGVPAQATTGQDEAQAAAQAHAGAQPVGESLRDLPAGGYDAAAEGFQQSGQEDDLLYLPGAQGAWSEQPRGTAAGAAGAADVGSDAAVAAAGAAGAADAGSDAAVDAIADAMTAAAAPGAQPAAAASESAAAASQYDSAASQSAAAAASGAQSAAAGGTPPGGTPTRRPLHLGPPVPDQSSGVVRSLADRGPAHGRPAHAQQPTTPHPAHSAHPAPAHSAQPTAATPPAVHLTAVPDGTPPEGTPLPAPTHPQPPAHLTAVPTPAAGTPTPGTPAGGIPTAGTPAAGTRAQSGEATPVAEAEPTPQELAAPDGTLGTPAAGTPITATAAPAPQAAQAADSSPIMATGEGTPGHGIPAMGTGTGSTESTPGHGTPAAGTAAGTPAHGTPARHGELAGQPEAGQSNTAQATPPQSSPNAAQGVPSQPAPSAVQAEPAHPGTDTPAAGPGSAADAGAAHGGTAQPTPSASQAAESTPAVLDEPATNPDAAADAHAAQGSVSQPTPNAAQAEPASPGTDAPAAGAGGRAAPSIPPQPGPGTAPDDGAATPPAGVPTPEAASPATAEDASPTTADDASPTTPEAAASTPPRAAHATTSRRATGAHARRTGDAAPHGTTNASAHEAATPSHDAADAPSREAAEALSHEAAEALRREAASVPSHETASDPSRKSASDPSREAAEALSREAANVPSHEAADVEARSRKAAADPSDKTPDTPSHKAPSDRAARAAGRAGAAGARSAVQPPPAANVPATPVLTQHTPHPPPGTAPVTGPEYLDIAGMDPDTLPGPQLGHIPPHPETWQAQPQVPHPADGTTEETVPPGPAVAPTADAGTAGPARATGTAAAGYPDPDREAVHRVIRERRDIRNGFRSDPVPHEVLLRVLEAAHTAPSVGHSQPWDFLVIKNEATRRRVHELAEAQRDAYAQSLPKGRAKQFKELKIEAILDTPVNIVVTADPTRGGRHTLGRHTQPQMAPYSSALAVENLWLAARAEGLGVGWVSFFDERELVQALDLPEHLEVVAYLCVGYVDEFPGEPELVQQGWSKRRPLAWVVHEESYGRRALPGEDPHDLLSETLERIRPLDAKALGEAWERQKRMTKPAGSLGMLEIISAQLCGLSRQCPPAVPEPAAVAIFAGDHGVHAQGVTPWPQEVTGQMVANFLGGGAVCNAFAAQVGAEVCVVDAGVASELPATPGLVPRKVRAGTADFTQGPAMTRDEVLRAVEVGIDTARDLVTAGNKALLTGEMGIANTTSSAAIISVFTQMDPAEVTGRGTGINDETHARKVEVVRHALDLHNPDPADPIGVLAAIGGLEHAALVGYILGGASMRTPVILDGVSAGAAALVARAIAPEALAACIAGHRSSEPGHAAALTKLGLRPLIDLDLRLGEGTGALLALPVVQSAARAMREVATFDAAGVTEKG
ncbi:nicotinate-nucleotide--dimethylbenzimidazole phosphoribosyltransferase [Streptomyces boninensis]|uniref:nicotinate-nucleotide--dimethylbenzimidazole phosphoribosyltransferase n=1 Tax=Streptomyces boninensis TaxID=2039455 RepID=UPI003B224691